MSQRVLIIKLSSMGDVIHTLPALTDASKHYPDMAFDWAVEPGFAEIPRWHPAVKNILTIPLRRWRQGGGKLIQSLGVLRSTHYDLVIDAQGLIKSATLSRLAKLAKGGARCGLDRQSAREGIASLAYHRAYAISKKQHAVERVRQLFAKALDYALPCSPVDYGLSQSKAGQQKKEIIFLHSTTWETKHWPESYWQVLGCEVAKAGYTVLLPWGTPLEYERASRIQHFINQNMNQQKEAAVVLPKCSLSEITHLISQAKGVVAVDTGLGHIAAAMGVPTISLYGPTDPGLTGAYGPSQTHLQARYPCSPCLGRTCKQGNIFAVNPPCFESLSPKRVWETLEQVISAGD